MRLQLALDRLSKERCFELVNETSEYIDWIEVGTGVIKEYGMGIVREMKDKYPDKVIVADMKTCDSGKAETEQAFAAGADVTTVMAFSADKTIQDCLEVAKAHNKIVVVDLLGVSDVKRIKQLSDLGADYLSVHIGKDLQANNASLDNQFELIKDFPNFKNTVAGGINLETLPSFLDKNIDVIIVGSAITKADNPKDTAARMKELIR